MKNIIITTLICLTFTAINFSIKTKAQSETILDYSFVSNGILTIGNETNYIEMNLETGAVEIQGSSLWIKGNSKNYNSDMATVYIDAKTAKIGGRNGNYTLITVSDEQEEINMTKPLIVPEIIKP